MKVLGHWSLVLVVACGGSGTGNRGGGANSIVVVVVFTVRSTDYVICNNLCKTMNFAPL